MNESKVKQIAKAILPPFITRALEEARSRWSSRFDFAGWWKGYRKKEGTPTELVQMVDAYVASDDFQTTSKYWRFLNRKHLELIHDAGPENFRATVAKNYFLYTYFDDGLADRLFAEAFSSRGEVFKEHKNLGRTESLRHNVLLIALAEALKNRGLLEKVKSIKDSKKFESPVVEALGMSLTQDKLTSMIEYDSISKLFGERPVKTVIEVGAGSGRTASCLLSLHPQIKYIIADIPPALYLSRALLREVFPEKKVFVFPIDKSLADVESEFNSADIVFMLPSQLKCLKDGFSDLFLAIDCLHEMLPGQIRYLFDQVDRLSARFYMKCWNKTTVPYDNHILRGDEYPYKAHWKKVFDTPCLFPANYFETGFQVR